MINVVKGPERALLVGVEMGRNGPWDIENSLEELSELADTAGAEVVDEVVVKLASPNAATFIGKGKTEELALTCQEEKVDVVIFDDDLNPAQSKNLQEILNVRVIDRTQLILDIFSRRARTKEAQFQVELAQLQYLLPRLTRQWLHLSRQVGGIGMRGPGETQLEVDRRRIKTRILKLSQELKNISIEREVQRKRRERNDLSVVSIVGYTNAGKTTLFNRLTESQNLAEDRLFATLDATVRKVEVNGSKPILFSDTVGFIRKLPHHLIESFKATLEEVVHSDMLIHVVDCADPLAEEKYDVVKDVIKDLNAQTIPAIIALNKIDLLGSVNPLHQWKRYSDVVVPISARLGQGTNRLLEEVVRHLRIRFQKMSLFIPHAAGDILDLLHREAYVVERRFEPEGVSLVVEVPNAIVSRVEPFRVKNG